MEGDEEIASIRESINREARQTQNEEVESVYSELDLSMQKQKARTSQLIAIPNAPCSVCNIEKESCIILTNECRHQACIDCIESKITLAIQQRLENRQKISVDLVMCKAAEYCENIMPLSFLLPLLNLNEQDHAEDIERIKDMYEDSICCIGEDKYQFVDQVKWMAHCLACKGKFCVVCVRDNLNSDRQSQRLTLAQCQCVRCPQCDSANTVNRDATKSYYCHICSENFCWSCHQPLNLCICFVQQIDPNFEEENQVKPKKKRQGGEAAHANTSHIIEERQKNIKLHDQRVRNKLNSNKNINNFAFEDESVDSNDESQPAKMKGSRDRSKSQGRSKKGKYGDDDSEECSDSEIVPKKPTGKKKEAPQLGLIGSLFSVFTSRPAKERSRSKQEKKAKKRKQK